MEIRLNMCNLLIIRQLDSVYIHILVVKKGLKQGKYRWFIT